MIIQSELVLELTLSTSSRSSPLKFVQVFEPGDYNFACIQLGGGLVRVYYTDNDLSAYQVITVHQAKKMFQFVVSN